MISQSTKSAAIVFSAPGEFSELQSPLLAAGFSSVEHLDFSQSIPTSIADATLVVGHGVERSRQVELVFQQHELGQNILLSVPEFRFLSGAVARNIGGAQFVPISGTRIGPISLGIQRALDIIIGSLALILILIPLTLILGPIILATSRGGIFFSTTVVGENGRKFTWRKFRSMRPAKPGDDESRRHIVAGAIRNGETDESSGSTKVVDDDRVTRIGKLIRKTSLDELPQLINVIRGSMSLVGPRPCLPYEYDEYNEWQRKRLAFKPGITGVWQVYGRSRVQFDEMVFMDICGRLNRSIIGDLKLVALTLPVALLGKGAE